MLACENRRGTVTTSSAPIRAHSLSGELAIGGVDTPKMASGVDEGLEVMLCLGVRGDRHVACS